MTENDSYYERELNTKIVEWPGWLYFISLGKGGGQLACSFQLLVCVMVVSTTLGFDPDLAFCFVCVSVCVCGLC